MQDYLNLGKRGKDQYTVHSGRQLGVENEEERILGCGCGRDGESDEAVRQNAGGRREIEKRLLWPERRDWRIGKGV